MASGTFSDPVDLALSARRAENAKGTVSVLAKLSGKGEVPEGARIVTQFGEIAAVEMPRRKLSDFVESHAVENIEVPRLIKPAKSIDSHPPDENYIPVSRRPPEVNATGRGSVIAVLDWGIDFASDAFVTRDQYGRPRMRLLGIFDQRGSDNSDNRWGYGRIYTREEIDRALLAEDPYEALGYHPGSADSRDRRSGRWQGAHGTHVMDIAAGNGRAGGPEGVAPEADLLFCHLARTQPLIGPGTLGDSANILHAIDWVFETAGPQPVVINASLGAHSGPHDGRTYAEIGIDRALELAPGRVMVNSAGNYFTKAAHASGRVREGDEHVLRLYVPPNDPTPSELELWHSAVDEFTVLIRAPGAERPIPVHMGSTTKLRQEGELLAHVTYGPRNNGDVSLWVVFSQDAPEGIWSLTIMPKRVADGRFHAWIERDSGLQPRFIGDGVDQAYTTGTICNGTNTITVGAIDGRKSKITLGAFSSSGPTRDGRVKPEVVAPGVSEVAARSSPPGCLPAPRLVAKSGTSMAAPHVTGTIALMQQCLGDPIPIAEMRKLFFSSLAQPPLGEIESGSANRLGFGLLDIAAAERAAMRWRNHNSQTEAKTMDLSLRHRPAGFTADTQSSHHGDDFADQPNFVEAEYLDDDQGMDANASGENIQFAWEDDFAQADRHYGEQAVHEASPFIWEDDADVVDADHYSQQSRFNDPMLETHGSALRALAPLDVTDDIPATDWIGDPTEQEEDSYCGYRTAIARIAREENAAWNTPRRLTESAPGRLPALVRYWAAVGHSPEAAQRLARRSAGDSTPWSAAFICYVMRSAGIRRADGFAFSGAHIAYIVQALRNRERSDQTKPFWLVDSIEIVNEVQLQPGDLVCFNRRIERDGRRIWTSHSYSSLREQYWNGENRNINPVSRANQSARITASHTSVVVGTRQTDSGRVVQCIGGNESNSVRLREYPINASGGIINPGAHRIFGAIKIVRC